MTDDIFFNGELNICDFSFADVSFQNDHEPRGQNTGELHGTPDLGDPWGIQHLTSDHYMSPPRHTCLEEIARLGEIDYGMGNLVEPRKEKQDSFSLTSLQILPRFGSGFRKLNSRKIMTPSDDTSSTVVVRQRSSTEEIIRIAEAKFLLSSFSRLSDEEAHEVELAERLLASASRVGNQQFDSASRLLNHCDTLSSSSGNPVQRLVHHVSGALRGKIDQETGKVLKGCRREHPIEICEEMMFASPTIAYYQSMPFMQILNFAGVQAIVDHVAEAKRIHIIDFRIRNGKQWIILMQALASRSDFPLHLLKITAVGTSTNHQYIQSTGDLLTSFAQTMNLPFSFKVVRVSDMIHLKDDFELDPVEKVVVFAEFLIPSLIKQPNRLNSLMKVIKNLNPCVMVLSELEANLSSPNFMSRFTEALVFFGAFFDSHESCMKRDDPARTFGESIFLSEVINSVMADDKGEMYTGCANMEVLRESFARFGMKEAGLSMSALYQANLMLSKFDCWNPCTLNIDGKSLITGWKALRERIDQETGRVSKGWRKEHPIKTCKEMVSASNTIEYYQRTPFLQVLNFAGVQAIVERVAEAKRIHIIDFRIRYGKQWIILMQALASRSDCPLQLLKITAVGTSTKNQYIQSTGESLISFARTMNLPFSFKVVRVSEMKHLKEDNFELDPEKTVAVFAEFLMTCLIQHPNRLDSLMKVIKNCWFLRWG